MLETNSENTGSKEERKLPSPSPRLMLSGAISSAFDGRPYPRQQDKKNHTGLIESPESTYAKMAEGQRSLYSNLSDEEYKSIFADAFIDAIDAQKRRNAEKIDALKAQVDQIMTQDADLQNIDNNFQHLRERRQDG